MQTLTKLLGLVLVLSAVTHAGSVAAPHREVHCWKHGEPFLFDFAVESYTKNTGAVTLKLTITYCPESSVETDCDLLTLTVYPVRGLSYTGQDTLLLPFRDESPITLLFDVIVPPEDTSALIFLWECGGSARFLGPAFVPGGDSVETFWAYPNYYSDLATERTMRALEPYLQRDYERAKRDWEAKQESLKILYPPEGKMSTGKTTPEAALLSKLRTLSPEDSSLFVTLSEQGKRRLLKMRSLERTPLTDAPREVIFLDGTAYVRYRGETKFHPVAPTTDPLAHAQRMTDSIRIEENREYDLTIDLRDPADYQFVRGLVDTLMPTERVGFYRTVVRWKTIMQLREHGIDFYKTKNGPPKPR